MKLKLSKAMLAELARRGVSAPPPTDIDDATAAAIVADCRRMLDEPGLTAGRKRAYTALLAQVRGKYGQGVARPPSDRGQGRKSIPEAERLKVITGRVTDAQKAKLGKLGGFEFVRAAIDAAPPPRAR